VGIPKYYVAYLQATRDVDAREERIQYLFLPPVHRQELLNERGTARREIRDWCQERADYFTMWRRRQDHEDHRSRWEMVSHVGSDHVGQLAKTVRFLDTRGTTWKPSPVITAEITRSALVADMIAGKTPYRAYNKLKGTARRVYYIDIS